MITITASCPACHEELPIELDGPSSREHGIVVTCDHCGVTRSLRAYRREYERKVAAEEKRQLKEEAVRESARRQRRHQAAKEAADDAREAACQAAAAALAERASPAAGKRVSAAEAPWKTSRGLKLHVVFWAGGALLGLATVAVFLATRVGPASTGTRTEPVIQTDRADLGQPNTSGGESAADAAAPESHYEMLRVMAKQFSVRGYLDDNDRPVTGNQAVGMVIGGAGCLRKPGTQSIGIEWRLNAGLTGIDPVSSLFVQGEGRRYGDDLHLAVHEEWTAGAASAESTPNGFAAAGVEVLDAADRGLRAAVSRGRPIEPAWQYRYAAEKRLGDYIFKCTIHDTIKSRTWGTVPGSWITLEFTFRPDGEPAEVVMPGGAPPATD